MFYSGAVKTAEDKAEVKCPYRRRGSQNRVWAWRNNPYEEILPAFTGMGNVIAQGEKTLDLFFSLFPDLFIEKITFQTYLLALQQGKVNFSLNTAEQRVFLGINLTMS